MGRVGSESVRHDLRGAERRVARPMAVRLWEALQAERVRLQEQGYTGTLRVEFDMLNGTEMRLRLCKVAVTEEKSIV